MDSNKGVDLWIQHFPKLRRCCAVWMWRGVFESSLRRRSVEGTQFEAGTSRFCEMAKIIGIYFFPLCPISTSFLVIVGLAKKDQTSSVSIKKAQCYHVSINHIRFFCTTQASMCHKAVSCTGKWKQLALSKPNERPVLAYLGGNMFSHGGPASSCLNVSSVCVSSWRSCK